MTSTIPGLVARATADSDLTTTAMSSIFTAPASCSESWTFEPEVANSVQNGLLLQNAAASDNADPACFPSGYNHYGRVQASLVYSPGYCPGGYTSAELAAQSSTTAAICCPSAFSYYEEARGDSETFAGCLSRLPSGSSTSVTVRQNSTSTEVSGPITMWAQAIQIELQASDLSLFVSATTTPTTTTTSSDTSSVPTSSATASSTPTSSTAPSTGSSGMSTGAKIGVGVGVGAGGLIILVALVFWLFRRRQNNQKKTLADAPSSFGGSRTAPSELGADGFGASPSYQRGGYVTPSELGSEPAGSTSKNANTTPSELYAAPPVQTPKSELHTDGIANIQLVRSSWPQTIKPRSPNFADPNFDPAEFLNDSLSPLTVASAQPSASRSPGSVPLTELSAQVQSLLSQISAQNIRLSSTLSQLTDEILRSGGRLAYEVEVLRGETIGLSETLTEVLRDDITKFVPGPSPEDGRKAEQEEDAPTNEDESAETEDKNKPAAPTDPEYITNLRTLNQVRSRLEDVVQTFGDAMSWPLPPSEISFSSSFISVSGPDLGPEGQDREEKGQEMMKKLRAEVTELLDSEGGGYAGLDAANRRVEALRTLAIVWNASAEEKARNRFVDSLANIVEDRRRTLDQQQADQNQRGQSKSRFEARRDSDSGAPAGGLFRNLQRLREEIYLE